MGEPIGHAHIRASDHGDVMLSHVEQLQYLKDKVKHHDSKFEVQDDLLATMNCSLDKISSNMTAIKWFVFGAAAIFTAGELGIITAVKLWFKLGGH